MEINEKTKIPLFSAVTIIPILVGAIAWATTLYVKVEAKERVDEKQDQKLEAQSQMLLDIRDDVKELKFILRKSNKGE
jgi:hypothetical protein